jgi:hypothetical protein
MVKICLKLEIQAFRIGMFSRCAKDKIYCNPEFDGSVWSSTNVFSIYDLKSPAIGDILRFELQVR